MLLKELMEGDEQPRKYTLFCDMDGVLVDFTSGAKKLFPTIAALDDLTTKKAKNELWKQVAGYKGDFWDELDPLPDMKQLWNYIKPYHPTILTATGTKVPSAGEQKKRWVKRHLGNVPILLVESGRDKHKYADTNHILIDDQEKAINPWKQTGGIGILHTSASATIKELKELGL